MNLKSLVIVTIIALLVAGISLWLNYYLVIRGQLAVLEVQAPEEISNWQTYNGDGFKFKYPEVFGANVWRPTFWPPKAVAFLPVQDIVGAGCPNLVTNAESRQLSDITLSGNKFSLYTGSGVGAGSLYSNYCYITEKNQKYYAIEFEIRSHTGCYNGECGAYCETQNEQECRNFDLKRDVESVIQKIVSTLSLIK